jgi:hypothetical protein
MARLTFLPSDDAYVRAYTGEPQAGIPVTVWTRQVGGTQVTDLVSVGYDGTLGAAITGGILVSDASGLLPAFAGPDGGPPVLWGSHGVSGERLALYSVSGGGGGGGGAVSSVVGQTGSVTGTQILADSTVSTALGLKAALASPALTGTPTVPTASPGTTTTQAASTAFTAAAVAVETTRATTAEGLAALKSANLSDLPSPSTARTNLGLGAAATMSTAAIAADAALTGTFGPGSDTWLKRGAAAFAFAFTGTPTYDTTTGLPTSANVKWDDGTTGTFTGTIDGGGNGYSGFAVTWAGSTTRTVTATGITYDANGNAVGPTGLAVS